MKLRQRFQHLRRLAPIVILHRAPVPWSWKRWTVWMLSPRHNLGVYVVVLNEANQVLSVRSAYSDRWQLPGGGVKHHETLQQAVCREALEEIGLELRNLRMVAFLTDSSGWGMHALFRAELGHGAIRLSEEHTEWCYLALDDLSPFYRRCLERVQYASEKFILVDRVEYSDEPDRERA